MNKERKQQIASAIVLGFLAGCILTKTLWDIRQPKPLITPLAKPQVMKPVVVEVLAANNRFCDTPIKCIRDVGEELGETNQHIMQMIRIAKAESGMRPDAMGKNTNGTFDIGLFQINDVHGKRISRADRLDFQKNIRFAYKLHQEQGHSFRAWVAYNNGLAK